MEKDTGYIREVIKLNTTKAVTIDSNYSKLNDIQVGDVVNVRIKILKKVDQ